MVAAFGKMNDGTITAEVKLVSQHCQADINRVKAPLALTEGSNLAPCKEELFSVLRC